MNNPNTIPNEDRSRFTKGDTSTTLANDIAIIAAPGAGLRLYIDTITVGTDAASTTRFDIKDGTDVIWSIVVPGPASHTVLFQTPLRLTANTALNGDVSTAVTTAFYNASGYIGA